MAAEEKLKSKRLYRIELYLIKVIPVILSAICLLNTILSYFGIDLVALAYLGGNSILSLIFLYISSVVFRFCVYHRLFIHYITLNWILNIIDYQIGIPITDRNLFLLYMIITGIFLFLIFYFKKYDTIKKETSCFTKGNSR